VNALNEKDLTVFVSCSNIIYFDVKELSNDKKYETRGTEGLETLVIFGTYLKSYTLVCRSLVNLKGL